MRLHGTREHGGNLERPGGHPHRGRELQPPDLPVPAAEARAHAASHHAASHHSTANDAAANDAPSHHAAAYNAAANDFGHLHRAHLQLTHHDDTGTKLAARVIDAFSDAFVDSRVSGDRNGRHGHPIPHGSHAGRVLRFHCDAPQPLH